jgi:hypothetical protein
LALVTFSGLALAVAAHGAAVGKDPLRIALRRADVPANAEKAPAWSPSPSRIKQEALSPLGPDLRGADFHYVWSAGGTVQVSGLGAADKQWSLDGSVFVAPSRAAAKRLFELGKRAQIGFFSDEPSEPSSLHPLSLPRYGDEQFGLLTTWPKNPPHALVFVRRGAVVWQLRIVAIPRQWPVTKTQTIAQLRTYAPKQAKRVAAR